MAKTYDPASYALAEHFLQGPGPRSIDPELYKKDCHGLALEIQQAIEDWFYIDAAASRPPHPPVEGGENG